MIDFYLILGSCVTTTGVHAIDNINTGALPTFTVRSEDTGGTHSMFRSAVGCKAVSLTGMINLESKFPYLSHSLTYLGKEMATPSLNATHTTGTRYPSTTHAMDGTEVKGRFGKTGSFAFHWDSGGDNIDYTKYLSNFMYTIALETTEFGIDNQDEPEAIDEGNYMLTYSFQLKRGADKSIKDDFEAKAMKNMYLTVYSPQVAANYLTLTWTNAYLVNCKDPYAAGNDVPRHHVDGGACDISISGKDGVHTTYYGE